MAWIEIKFLTTPDRTEDLSEFLNQLGALAITIEDAGDQPLYEPMPDTTPLWDQVQLTGLFDHQIIIDSFLARIKEKFPEQPPTVNYLADQEWERSWMKDFQPMQFGERLWVVPSYRHEEISPHQIVLDPGLAFGTGKHPTTALCLHWLDEHIQGGECVIDYGCGSGILGIAAVKLGAKKVFAIDHDPQAIIATEENALNNDVSSQVMALIPNDFKEKKMADMLIANILANPLKTLASEFAKMLVPTGQIALSGILIEQASDVIAAFEPWFVIDRQENQEEWVLLSGYLR